MPKGTCEKSFGNVCGHFQNFFLPFCSAHSLRSHTPQNKRNFFRRTCRRKKWLDREFCPLSSDVRIIPQNERFVKYYLVFVSKKCRGRRPRRPALHPWTRLVHRRTGRCPQRPLPPITGMYRFIGTVPVPQRGHGRTMGPPLREIWEVIPFDRHGRSLKRGPPGVAAPTA